MNNVLFLPQGWNDYLYWQKQDKRMARRINQLIEDSRRSPFSGIGKPEPLKHNWTGWWSRRIDDTHRLVYKVEKDHLVIAACRTHYGY